MDVLIALGEAQRRAGDPAFRETLLGVARMAQGYGDDGALIRAALATNRGVWSAVWTVDRDRVAVLEAALVAAGPADSAARARLLADLGAELAFSGEPSRRLALTGEAIRIARDLGDPVTLAHCLIARCAATFVDPDSLADSLGTTAELVETADRLRDPFIRAWGRYHRYWATFQAGRREEADEALGAFERAAIEAGQPVLRWASTLVRAGRSIAAASLSEAEEIGRKVRDDIVFFSEPDAPSFFGMLRYVIRYEQGRLDELITRLEVTARTTDRAAAWALLALAYCELERGDQARRVWERLATTVGDTSIGPVGGTVMAPTAEVCARLGDTVAAAKLYERLLPHADQIAGAPVGWFGPVAHFLGLLAATLGRVEDAERHFADAEATNERMAAPSWLARTRLEWGRMLVLRGGTGDADRARALLGQALAAARQLGLGTVERRAAAMLDQHT
jgi:tetratricopeptide (TPR) repeat protein